MDSGCMLFHQSSEDEFLEYSEGQNGQQIIQHRAISRICDESYSKSIGARRDLHQTGEEQQSISFYFHRLPPFSEQCSFFRIKNPRSSAGISIKGPADDFQHRIRVIIPAQQGGQHQGKQDICKFLRGKLTVKSIRANSAVPF